METALGIQCDDGYRAPELGGKIALREKPEEIGGQRRSQ
jgi:hypothetical protein